LNENQEISFKRLSRKKEMKRIEVTIPTPKIGLVSDAINDLVGGFSILEGNGRGSSERQIIRAGRGTETIVAEYNKVSVIITIVNDSDVEKVVSAIENAAFTGKSGDGIIAISTIDSVLNIASKKMNSKAL
jgi:nitrogen regulatory protein P-II 1|tara:strand:+ start:13835 stop:14227 length:393 start_codon:yes stop_codon:yes gene_type:complete